MQRDAYDGALAATSVAAAVGDGSDPATVIQQMAQVCQVGVPARWN
jgi:hypothetical protein